MSLSPHQKAIFFRANALKEGVAIVRRVLANHDCSNGLTTSDIYQLASREAAPPDYKGDPRFNFTSGNKYNYPPQNNHPVRSKVFLKHSILPTLVGSQEIKKMVVTREITAPIQAKSKKGKVSAKTIIASPESPATVKAWVWKPIPPAERNPLVNEVRKEPFGASVGVNEDWSHLNKRRRGAREEKVQRDIKLMKQLREMDKKAL